ncbi:outer membrane protein assembly factor BamA [Rubellicoccus peritrichatus]|uniref:Outer membrane protein assembly factor BamA n=1 Tax=Rubellicoccus peritrichatus TaxID=3080537 RepID=A0AAQ3L994_9BACT|nr:outer membrane protein assembly factor BamA [Puniceicoccus sp. CR14]WOO41186.1 outer membrane protein assembly factor BamA [Puniceicoccus sp. CR14]
MKITRLIRHSLNAGHPTAFLTLLIFLASPLLQAQMIANAENQVVDDIEIKFEGAQTVSVENVLAHVRLRQGQPYSQALVDQSIRALYATGNFEFIEVRRQNLAGGGIRVEFVVVPKYRISAIKFEGNSDISDSRLKEEIENEVGMPLDEVQVKRDSTKIFQYLQKKGYTNAVVSYDIIRDEEVGSGEIIFNVDEGERLKVDDIKFVGNDNISSGDLRDVMETSEYFFLWSWITGSGRLQEEEFQDDLELLRTYYKNKGFLDVEIPESEVMLEYPKEGWMNIVINVTEGRRYYIGNITFEGNELFTTEQLEKVLTIKTGDVFSPEEIDKNVETLKDFYGEVGYLDTFVRVERFPDLNSGDIDLKFVFTEGEKFFVETINLQGNTKTKSTVIVRELALAPGDVFDLVRMKSSQARLENTRYFDAVNLSPEATNLPNRRNLRVTVKEGRTGNLTFGAGFSSVESIVGFVEVSQSNFDLFNYRSGFQGAGQKFRIRLSAGSRTNQILISFEEPWVYQRELAFGFEIYRTDSDFLSADYDEIRTGFEVYLRKRLFELVEGRLSYRLENVEISDVVSTAPQTIQDEAGSRSVSQVSWTMLRDTRDNLVFPTRGSRVQSITNVAGGPFLGQTNLVRQEIRAAKWFKTFDFLTQTIMFSGRTGTVFSYGGKDVPFFEKYFLGGPYTLRGFKFRQVGPQVGGEPVGGETMGLVQVEYTFRILEPLGFAVFYDGGFVNSGNFDWGTNEYNDDFGFGLRIILLGAPLNLDFGFPIQSTTYSDGSTNDDGMQFNFSFGTVF